VSETATRPSSDTSATKEVAPAAAAVGFDLGWTRRRDQRGTFETGLGHLQPRAETTSSWSCATGFNDFAENTVRRPLMSGRARENPLADHQGGRQDRSLRLESTINFFVDPPACSSRWSARSCSG